MPKLLDADIWFPPTQYSSAEGLLAVGGDLRIERLVYAYSKGIFPWYGEDTPILWWTPPLRCVLPMRPCALYVSQRLARKYNTGVFRHTIDTAFEQVITQCASVPRPGQSGTWLLPEMQEAYIRMHQAGYAHSAECWLDGELVGGVYGVGLGKAFFGESMFHTVSDASKMALMTLVRALEEQDVQLFDCQQDTPHMLRMGAEVIPRQRFEYLLKLALMPRKV